MKFLFITYHFKVPVDPSFSIGVGLFQMLYGKKTVVLKLTNNFIEESSFKNFFDSDFNAFQKIIILNQKICKIPVL